MALLMIFAVILFSNCQTVETVLREPAVSLASVELANISFNGLQLLSKVRVENPNGFEIPFPEVGWDLFINDNSFADGVIRNNQRIRARGATLVEIPVNLGYLEVFNTFASLVGRNQSDYKIALAVNIPLPVLGNRVWNFEHEGVFPLLQAPRLSMPSLRIDRMDLSGAEIVVSVNVDNPNVFALPPPRISYDLLVNRASFVQNQMEAAAPLAASSSTPVSFRTTIDYASVLRGFVGSLTAGEVPIQFNLDFDFAIPFFSGQSLQIPGTLPLPRF